jgi:hypothetical protein
VHIPIGIIARRPLLGVLLGLGVFALMVYLFISSMREYRGFGATPQQVDLRTVPLPPTDRGLWVRISQPLRVHCEILQEMDGSKVEKTYRMAEIENSDRWLMLDQKCDTSCESVMSGSMTGILATAGKRLADNLRGRGLNVPMFARVLRLSIGESPAEYRKGFWWMALLGALGLGLAGYYLREHLRETAARDGSSLGS